MFIITPGRLRLDGPTLYKILTIEAFGTGVSGKDIVLAIIGAGDGIPALLAWIYTGLRIIHTIVQVTANKVMVRFVMFAMSSLVLIALIGIAAARVFGG